MVLAHFLSPKRTAIIEKWFQLILDTYPADSSRFLGQEKDNFLNPVGCTISREIEIIFDELLGEMNTTKLATSLDNVIRIRSVQDFAPSQAVGFVFLLKKAIMEELSGAIQKDHAAELRKFDSRIDQLALLAVDIYTKCREQICEIRVNEVKAEKEMALRILARADLLSEVDEV